jgi:hypothetical protein
MYKNMRFEVFAVVMLPNIFMVVVPFDSVSGRPEDGSHASLRKVGNHLQDYTLSEARKQRST